MSDISKLQGPDCGAPMRAFNRNGWYYAECDRRYSPKLREWASAPEGCLRRQRDLLRYRLEEARCPDILTAHVLAELIAANKVPSPWRDAGIRLEAFGSWLAALPPEEKSESPER